METDVRELSVEEMSDLYGGDWWYFTVGVVLGAAFLAPMLAPELLVVSAVGGALITWY